MTVSLGGIVLDDDLRLVGDLGPQIAMSVRRTFGAPVAQRCQVTAGKVLVLSADMDGNDIYGEFTRTQYQQIAALRDGGNPIDLVHHNGTYQVIIPSDGINLTSIDDHSDPGPDESYTGTITMITV